MKKNEGVYFVFFFFLHSNGITRLHTTFCSQLLLWPKGKKRSNVKVANKKGHAGKGGSWRRKSVLTSWFIGDDCSLFNCIFTSLSGSLPAARPLPFVVDAFRVKTRNCGSNLIFDAGTFVRTHLNYRFVLLS